jgi:hypothetical protein
MCQNFLRNYESFFLAFQDHLSPDEAVRFPSREEQAKLSAAEVLLSKAKELTLFTQGARYLTLPHLPVLIRKLLNEVEKLTDSYGYAQSFFAILQQRLIPIVQAGPVLLSTILHPCHSRNSETILSDEEWNMCATWLSEWLKELNSTDCEEPTQDSKRRRVQIVPDVTNGSDVVIQASLNQLLDHLAEATCEFNVAEPLNATADCAEFYKGLKAINPMWFELARTIFCAPATSATSERVLSASGLIDHGLRNRMDPSTLEKITVCYFFLKRLSQEELASFWSFVHGRLEV